MYADELTSSQELDLWRHITRDFERWAGNGDTRMLADFIEGWSEIVDREEFQMELIEFLADKISEMRSDLRQGKGNKVKVICAWCGKSLGEKEPKEDKSTTHGICDKCERKMEQEQESKRK